MDIINKEVISKLKFLSKIQIGDKIRVEIKKSRYQVNDTSILSVGIFKGRVKGAAGEVAEEKKEEEFTEVVEEGDDAAEAEAAAIATAEEEDEEDAEPSAEEEDIEEETE
jgi:hypothetical protein